MFRDVQGQEEWRGRVAELPVAVLHVWSACDKHVLDLLYDRECNMPVVAKPSINLIE